MGCGLLHPWSGTKIPHATGPLQPECIIRDNLCAAMKAQHSQNKTNKQKPIKHYALFLFVIKSIMAASLESGSFNRSS